MWVADGMAHGLRPWFTKFNAQPIDRRWLPVAEELYGWHYRNERYLRNETSLARVAMVYSQQTATFYGGEQAPAKVEDPALGFYQALVEARIPFEMVLDELLDSEHLGPFRTLILPNIAALSTKQCDQIHEYVSKGGSIIATYETSLYDEWCTRGERHGPVWYLSVTLDQAHRKGSTVPSIRSNRCAAGLRTIIGSRSAWRRSLRLTANCCGATRAGSNPGKKGGGEPSGEGGAEGRTCAFVQSSV